MTTEEWRAIEQVLAEALVLPEDQRASFLARTCAHRPEVLGEVQALLSVRNQADAAFGNPSGAAWAGALSDPATLPGQKLGPYRVVRRLGTGGMGEVSLAERDDDQFRRQVAIKMVTTSMASPEVLARFRSECQILATLDHPNIAGLIDAGISENGRPFFVMEYVDGVPLMEFCRKHDVTVRQRLQLFRAICSAVHFAHQNLIVHRDIKPGNILVTPDGTPKLLDFGIAKILGSSPAATATVTLSNIHPMTPEYASPEQLRGGTITTVSDVYSLGVLLYELLTGKRPFDLERFTLEQAASVVSGTEPPRPSRAADVRPELEGDLDSIVLKALRSEPRERYGSAEDLSADIGRYLGRLPVLARRGTFRYVAGKFVGRHRAAVAAALTAGVLLLAGGAAVLHSARVADSERAKAQQRLEQVRQLSNSLIFDLHDGIATLPGSIGVRKQLVARALEYLDALEKESSGDPRLQLNLAQSYERLGSVQGHISEMNLGDPQGALTSYGRAIEILRHLPAGVRERAEPLKELVHLYVLRGDIYRDLRQSRARDQEYGQALGIIAPLAERSPDDESILTLYSTCLFGMGKSRSAGDSESSRSLFLRSLAIDTKLLQAHPDKWIYQRGLALDHKYLASVLSSPAEALDHLRQAQVLDEKRVSAQPYDVQAKLDLSFDLSEIASRLQKTGELPRALELCRRVQSMRQELAAANPLDAQIRFRVITAGKAVAEVLADMGRTDAALAEYRAEVVRVEQAIAAVPADPRIRQTLGEIELGIAATEARIASRAGRSPQAGEHRRNSCRAYARAAEILGKFVNDGIATSEETRMTRDAERGKAACVAPE